MAKSLKRYHWNLLGIWGAKLMSTILYLQERNLLPLVVERRDSDVSHKVTGSLHPAFLHMRHNHAQFIHHTALPRERSTGLSVSHALSPPHLGLPSQRLGPPLPQRWSECEEPSYLPVLLPLSAAVSRTLSHPLPQPDTAKWRRAIPY